MEFIHNFWVKMLPMFSDFGFVYIFFDLITILALLYCVVVLPVQLFLGGMNSAWKD